MFPKNGAARRRFSLTLFFASVFQECFHVSSFSCHRDAMIGGNNSV